VKTLPNYKPLKYTNKLSVLRHTIWQLPNMMLPLKRHIAQLRMRLYVPTVKDIMHINELIQYGKLPYGKSILYTDGWQKMWLYAAMFAAEHTQNSKSLLYINKINKFLEKYQLQSRNKIQFQNKLWTMNTLTYCLNGILSTFSNESNMFLCHESTGKPHSNQ